MHMRVSSCPGLISVARVNEKRTTASMTFSLKSKFMCDTIFIPVFFITPCCCFVLNVCLLVRSKN